MTDRRQRQKQAIAAKREADRKQASRRELIRRVVVALALGLAVVAVLVLTSLRSQDELPESYLDFRAQPTACGADPPAEEELLTFEEPAPQTIDPASPVMATIETSCGPITIALDPAAAPQTVESFVFLAGQGYYDGTVFHRIEAGARVIGGDHEADGTGNPGYRAPDEFPPAGTQLTRGTVALANTGSGTSAAAFFIVLTDDPPLSTRFNIFGEVVDGFDTLDQMAEVPTRVERTSSARTVPAETIYINSITIGG